MLKRKIKKNFTEKGFRKSNKMFQLLYIIAIVLFCIGLLILLSILV